jgi:hypothetical protein
MVMPTEAKRMWFKVTGSSGESVSGGYHRWSLPVDGKPGEWAPDVANPIACRRGYHLTLQPVMWLKSLHCKVWVAEGEGAETAMHDGEKKAFERARLVRLATVAELAALRIVSEGYHEFSGDLPIFAYDSVQVTAYDSAQVTAYGSAQVSAYGSAQVTATGSVQVTAYGSAQVSAYGSAQVTATGSVQVTAYGSAQVTAYGSAQVTATGSVQVTAYGSAQVTAYGSATIIQPNSYMNKSKVEIYQEAVRIDRRGARVRCFRAKGGKALPVKVAA